MAFGQQLDEEDRYVEGEMASMVFEVQSDFF